MFESIHQEVANEGYLQQRARFRLENWQRVRRRERLPEHDGEKYLVDGKRVGLAVGCRKSVGAGLPMSEGMLAAAEDQEVQLEILKVSDLVQELEDLDRDAGVYEKWEGVRFDAPLPWGFDVPLDDSALESDDALLDWTRRINEGLGR